MVGRPASKGMIASDPYVNENGVSPVDRRGVVRYAHRICGSSLTHAPFARSSRFFNPSITVLLEAST